MKTYSFVEPLHGHSFTTLEVVMTEDDIIDHYYDHWSERLKDIGKEDQINRENCIEDFIIGNWAIEWEDSYVELSEGSFVRMSGQVVVDYKMWKEYHKWVKENY